MAEGPTLLDLLDRAAAAPGAGLRFVDRREESSFLSWSEIRSRALGCASGLVAAGLEPGDRVGIVYPTGPGFFDAFFGVMAAGGVPVPLYPPIRFGRLDEYTDRTAAMLRAVAARLVLADSRVRRLLGEAVASAAPDLGCRTLEMLSPASSTDDRPLPRDLAMIQFSSGTTRDPRPVALSHRAVVAQTTRLNAFWPDGNGHRHSGASWLPLYHDMGLIGCVFPALERPAVLTLIPPELFVTRPAVWLRAISDYGATVSPAPNFAYGLCVEKIRDEELEGVDLSSWKVALNGAEPVAAGVLHAFERRFAAWGFAPGALTPVYGLSEASLAVTFSEIGSAFSSRVFDRERLARDRIANQSEDGVEIVSVGRPLPDFEIRIVSDDGEELPSGAVGRVMVRGPSLMDGYFGQPEATARVLRGGWLDTGDLGFEFDGELYLTGRAKDVIILRGRNHAPAEVEHAADGVDGVRSGCTLAASFLPDGGSGEQLVILAEVRRDIPRERFDEIAGKVAVAVRAATGLEPDHVDVLAPGTLPRTSSGKIRRSEGLQQWREGGLESPRAFSIVRMAGALVRSRLAMPRSRRGRARS